MVLENKKAIIFDLDNTLINSGNFIKNNLKKALKNIGKESQYNETEIIKVLKENLDFSQIFTELYGKEGEIILKEYRKISPNEIIKPIEGTLKLVKELKKKNKILGILTDRTRMVEERLIGAGFDLKDFDFINSPTDGFKKPHFNFLKPVIKYLNQKGIKENEMVLIGDHITDYETVKDRLDFIAVLNEYSTSRKEFEDCNTIIYKNINELLKSLEMNQRDFYVNNLKNISAADGRHCLLTEELREYFSEHALHKYRLLVQVKHLIKLSKTEGIGIKPLDENGEEFLNSLFKNFDINCSSAVAEYDHFGRKGIGPTEHDVKSVEIYLIEKLKDTDYEYLIPWIHFGFTSADVNNLAYSSKIRDGVSKVFLPNVLKLCDKLKEISKDNKSVPLLSRTHGQPASPTTFGKEMVYFLKKLTDEINELKQIKLSGKMNGAVGNYNAHKVGYKNVDWIKYSKEFVESFGFEWEPISTQRGPKGKHVKLFQTIIRINSIIKDLNIDLWLYVSKDLVLEKKIETHVGSSVMPHKINPWLIECSEANVEISNALFEVFSRESQISRLQRDLSDHDHERNYGLAFSYAIVALKYTTDFMGRIVVNSDLMLKELEDNKKVLSEAYQTILRTKGVSGAYDIFKNAFRGREEFSHDELIEGLDVDDSVKTELKQVKVSNYSGHAEELVDLAIDIYDEVKNN